MFTGRGAHRSSAHQDMPDCISSYPNLAMAGRHVACNLTMRIAQTECPSPANVSGVDGILLEQQVHCCKAHGHHIFLVSCECHVLLAQPQCVLTRLHPVICLQILLGDLSDTHFSLKDLFCWCRLPPVICLQVLLRDMQGTP